MEGGIVLIYADEKRITEKARIAKNALGPLTEAITDTGRENTALHMSLV